MYSQFLRIADSGLPLINFKYQRQKHNNFQIEDKNIVVERLVCNFAPKGNLQGTPVYAVGFTATQCPKSLFPDKTMEGLCTVRKRPLGKISLTKFK